MKRLLFIGLLTMALARVALGQASPVFINNGQINSPPDLVPQVDATNFLNNGLFNIGFNNFNFTNLNFTFFNFYSFNTALPPYDFSDVLNYTNRGTMACDTGFQFDTAPSGNGPPRHMAASFMNTTTGSISAGSATNTFGGGFFFFGSSFFSTGVPIMKVSATNVVNTGTLDVGINGNLLVSGRTVSLGRGLLHLEGQDEFADLSSGGFVGLLGGGFAFGSSLNVGIFANYWGVGIDTNQTGNFRLPTPQSPFVPVTNNFQNGALGGLFTASTFVPNALAFVTTNQISISNNTFQVVFINTNAGMSTDVRFDPAGDLSIPVVQWLAIITNNNPSITPVTNTLYLSDTLGATTNLAVQTNSISISGQPQISPTNYTFGRAFSIYNLLPTANAQFDPSLLFTAQGATNSWSAYSVNVEPVTAIPDPSSPASNVTNTPGRIEITADQVLDLNRARISGPNYVRLTATNHFAGSANAQIIMPTSDINLGSTNGQLNITNLVVPNVPRFTGTIDMWSGKWTNIVTATNIDIIAGTTNSYLITNRYHVLMVDATLVPTALSEIRELTLRSTNVVISDILNVTSNLLVNAERLTITSNSFGASSTNGQINLLTPDIVWSAGLPTLKYLTNSGILNLPNSVYFAGLRQPPYYTTTFDEPYQALVNHGSILSSGNSTWANYFENTATGTITTNSDFSTTVDLAAIYSSIGPINVQAGTAVMGNGYLWAAAGDLSVASGSLSVSNHYLLASGNLTLQVTNSLSDGGSTASNIWEAGDGFSLLVKPATGDLLNTTVTNSCPDFAEVVNVWAGTDFGASTAGYVNNGAVGHLILDGGTDCLFTFTGAGVQNALYVDLLELKDGATNRSNPDFTALNVTPNMKVYFADARMGSLDISEKLNGANGGSLVWVPSYAGRFSSTNITYPSGVTYTLNRALVTSPDIDSNGNGSPNNADPYPIFEPENVVLSIQMASQPVKTPLISWQSLANSTNYLFFKTNSMSANWMTLTNFVQPFNGQVTVADRLHTNVPCFYKVRIDVPNP